MTGSLLAAKRCLYALTSVLMLAFTLNAGALEVGDTAPDFLLQGSDGQIHSLSKHRDMHFVVIAFFPKAFTGG